MAISIGGIARAGRHIAHAGAVVAGSDEITMEGWTPWGEAAHVS
jgi:hypothetical protein